MIFERARFNRRCQQPDESAEQFITSLYSLAENCAYGELKGEMIRDCIVVGIRDRSLSVRLQMIPDLTLERLRLLYGNVKEQQALLRHCPKQELAIDFIRGKQSQPLRNRGHKIAPRIASNMRGNQPRVNTCSSCGQDAHSRELCPAKDAVCHKCRKKGQYSSQCFAKAVSEVTTTDSVTCDGTYDTSYLTVVTSEEANMSWKATVTVNGQMLSFKLDAGAAVTAISEQALQQLR